MAEGVLRETDTVVAVWALPEGDRAERGPWWIVRLIWAASFLREGARGEADVRLCTLLGVETGPTYRLSMTPNQAREVIQRDAVSFTLATADEVHRRASGDHVWQPAAVSEPALTGDAGEVNGGS